MILSAPSGCGKTTLLDRLLKRHSDWIGSISVTTRPPRLGEKKGKDYQFVTLREFQSLKKRRQFLEWAKVFGSYYGTLKKVVEEGAEKGRTVVLTVDIQGARSIRRALKRRIPIFSIFVLPPSIRALRERLEKRSTDRPEEIEKRIQRAQEEIKVAKEYDVTVINRDLDQTVHEMEELITGFERKLQKRRK